ncbi:hypothetical protein HCJ33_10215 [Listeria seeligeri]|uniref:DUF6710 family protein n=1 Tax=Listeria seeligeri TaxID=1640 RepID=UPI00162A8D68|nr:DUF6710 family protein [Listeria seeligeri]MBC1990341.1 hypothetical protein [Listeria seeligeri]
MINLDYFKVNRKKSTHSNSILFHSMLDHAKEILKYESYSEEPIHPIFTYMKQLTDLITCENGVQSLTIGSLDSSQEIYDVFEGGNQLVQNKIKQIIFEKPHPEDLFAFRDFNFYLHEQEVQLEFSNAPIILNPWKPTRTVAAIEEIETTTNRFDSQNNSWNLNNSYYYPIGVTLCQGGHHSQYSAKLKGSGSTIITNLIDIRDIYKEVSFVPKRWMNKHVLYAGILFEIGRILLDYPEVFPEGIRECIENNEKIK